MTRTVAVGAALALVACGTDAPPDQGTAATTRSLLSAPSGGPSTQIRPAPVQDTDQPRVEITPLGFDLGDSVAPVRLIEMSDYGCGFCRQFHMETFPTLREQFIDSGKVLWKFIPFINGMFENSLAATEAAQCTLEQGRDLFEVLNERLWTDQSTWKGSRDAESVVRGMAQEAGVDLAAFDVCLAGERQIERIALAGKLADQLAVRGTPTFFIVGYPPIQGAIPLELFQQVLEAVHEEATDPGGG